MKCPAAACAFAFACNYRLSDSAPVDGLTTVRFREKRKYVVASKTSAQPWNWVKDFRTPQMLALEQKTATDIKKI